MSAASSRDIAKSKARRDISGALKTAESIKEPWFRAQAIATVGRYASAEQRDRILKSSIKTAFEEFDCDPFKTVAVSAWPLRAYVELEDYVGCRRELLRVLEVCDHISNPVCKCDALILLYQATFSLGSDVRNTIVEKAILTSLDCFSWRAQRNMMNLASFVNLHEPRLATRIIENMPDGRFRREARRLMEEGCKTKPREFSVFKYEYIF